MVTLLRALGIAAIALIVLQQTDKVMWWHACQFRGIRKRADTEELYRTGAKARRFLVPTKIIPAALICIGLSWMTSVEGALGGLLTSLVGLIAFMTASMMDSLHTLWRLDGR